FTSLVEVDQRRGLRMIDLEPLAHGIFMIITALYQWFTRDVVDASLLRWIVLHVIDSTTGIVDPAAAAALDYFLVIHGNLDDIIDQDAGIPQRFGLWNGSWKTVEEKSIG